MVRHTDLTDQEWSRVEYIWRRRLKGGRPGVGPKHSYRAVINAIRHKSNAHNEAWRELPKDLPPWQTVYTTMRQWQRDGTWRELERHIKLHPRPMTVRANDQEWSKIKAILDPYHDGDVPERYRELLDGMLAYFARKHHARWNEMPIEFPPWRDVREAYVYWRENGLIDKIYDQLPRHRGHGWAPKRSR